MRFRTGLALGLVAAAAAVATFQVWSFYRPAHAGTPSHVKAMVFSPYDEQKIVYHITQRGGFRDGAYKSALTQIASHVAAVGDGFIDVRVILQGEGVGLLVNAKTNPALAREITRLRAHGVRFVVCHNTIVTHDIDPQQEMLDVRLD
jgi:intracellular sulfur oxidation DsrE/DsrF family protein